MTTEEKVKQIAAACGGKVYPAYSGRGMFGAECWGVSCDNASAALEAAGSLGVKGGSVDQLGKGYIVYWRSLKYKEAA